MTRKMPKQRPGESEQVVQTPPEFIAAVERVFGRLDYDFAALSTNRVNDLPYFGPDHPDESYRDGVAALWPEDGIGWLNPEFSDIHPWAYKCYGETMFSSLHVLMLVPASVGANWYRDWVQPYADVYSVGRMKFVGHKHLYPKDLILCHYWKLGGGKFKHWEWRK